MRRIFYAAIELFVEGYKAQFSPPQRKAFAMECTSKGYEKIYYPIFFYEKVADIGEKDYICRVISTLPLRQPLRSRPARWALNWVQTY